MSQDEVDVLRAAIIMTSSGLDAGLKRLVNDVGRHLIGKPATGARAAYQEYLKRELSKPSTSTGMRNAITDMDPTRKLLDLHLADRTRASLQGSGELRVRVREVLGIPAAYVPDERLASLDDFFVARNRIAHDMDYTSASAHSVKRHHRNPETAAAMCSNAFDVAVALISGAAMVLKRVGV